MSSLVIIFACAFWFINTEVAFSKYGNVENEYTYLQKETYLQRTENELLKLRRELINLEANAKQVKKNAKAEAEKKIKVAKIEISKLDEQLEILKTASENKWEEAKTEFDEAVDTVRDNIYESRKWLSEKIAP